MPQPANSRAVRPSSWAQRSAMPHSPSPRGVDPADRAGVAAAVHRLELGDQLERRVRRRAADRGRRVHARRARSSTSRAVLDDGRHVGGEVRDVRQLERVRRRPAPRGRGRAAPAPPTTRLDRVAVLLAVLGRVQQRVDPRLVVGRVAAARRRSGQHPGDHPVAGAADAAARASRRRARRPRTSSSRGCARRARRSTSADVDVVARRRRAGRGRAPPCPARRPRSGRPPGVTGVAEGGDRRRRRARSAARAVRRHRLGRREPRRLADRGQPGAAVAPPEHDLRHDQHRRPSSRERERPNATGPLPRHADLVLDRRRARRPSRHQSRARANRSGPVTSSRAASPQPTSPCAVARPRPARRRRAAAAAAGCRRGRRAASARCAGRRPHAGPASTRHGAHDAERTSASGARSEPGHDLVGYSGTARPISSRPNCVGHRGAASARAGRPARRAPAAAPGRRRRRARPGAASGTVTRCGVSAPRRVGDRDVVGVRVGGCDVQAAQAVRVSGMVRLLPG